MSQRRKWPSVRESLENARKGFLNDEAAKYGPSDLSDAEWADHVAEVLEALGPADRERLLAQLKEVSGEERSDEIARWSTATEGQFFERKSALDGARPSAKRRRLKDLAWDIAETLSAMANADGGELVVGIENGGTVTGIPHGSDDLRLLRGIPQDRNYVDPGLNARVDMVDHAAGALLRFSVDWSPQVHRLGDGRYLLRVNDSNQPFPAEQIAALKSSKGLGLVERGFPTGATIEDLDLDVVADAMRRAGWDSSVTGYLTDHQLVETRAGQVVPRFAALLLFGKVPFRWHPRCGVDIVRWEGTRRQHGAELNVTKRVRVEEPLAALIERAYDAIRPLIRERQQLRDLFFTETLEYPTFVWQEAIVNAVAHRDYGIQGAGIEVWLFDDHMEVRSPGLPPQPVTIDALNQRAHLHLSRNPLIVRILSELGYVRELGEGIPRMFDVMEDEGFYPPHFDAVGDLSFQVVLRNQPIYGSDTLSWLQQFRNTELSGDQRRLLAYAHEHGGRFTNREYRKLTALDMYGAVSSIRGLIRKGLVRSTAKGSRVYELVTEVPASELTPDTLSPLLPMLRWSGSVNNGDVRRALGISARSASRLLERLVTEGWIARKGSGRWTRYSLGDGQQDDARFPKDDSDSIGQLQT